MIRYIFLLLTVASIISADDSSPQLLINIPSLGLIQGEINPLVDNVRQFIGIPFAQSPIGKLRFKPPVPLRPVVNGASSTIYNATAAAHQGGLPLLRCLQISDTNPHVVYGQEDCLYLDIFLPINISNGTLLPVVIYIYGGGFQVSDPHDPSELI
jgi:carboxylesterase type B